MITRATQVDLEIRSDGRTVCGICVPYDSPTQIRDASGAKYSESFRRGAFARTIQERSARIKFMAMHDQRALPIGRATLLREDAAGLYGEFRVSQTPQGDSVLALIADSALDSLSISFAPLRDEWSSDRRSVVRTEAKLYEVSAVSYPAYESALISSVRAAQTAVTPIPIDQATARLDTILRNWSTK